MFEISMKQIPAYVVVKKRYIPNEEDEKPSELDLPEYHYIPDDRQIPVIGDDNKYICTRMAVRGVLVTLQNL